MTTFQVEPVSQWEYESKDLVYEHWQELGLDLDLEISPDYEKMKLMESLGMFHVITARDEGRMVGYLLVIINEHLHYKSAPKMLVVDAYYVDPKARTGTGVKMIRFMEEFSKKLDAIKIYLTCKVHSDHSELFTAMGYKLSDFCFIKRV